MEPRTSSVISSEQSRAYQEDKGLEDSQVVVVAGGEVPEVAKPGKEPLNRPATLVPAQLPTILGLRTDPPSSVGRDEPDTPGSEQLVERVGVVRLVTKESLGLLAGECMAVSW